MESSLNAEEGIFHYYVFQKKLENYLYGGIYKKDNTKYKEGYLLNPNYVSIWKKDINYKEVENFLAKSMITSYKINKEQKANIERIIKSNINQFYYTRTNSFNANKNDYLQVSKIIDKKYLERIVNKKIFDSLVGSSNSNKQRIYYIFKQKMLIIFFPDYYIIKMIISSLAPYSEEKKIVNLTFVFYFPQYYDKYAKIFQEDSSQKIIDWIIRKGIFDQYQCEFFSKNQIVYLIYNEEQYIMEKKQKQIQQIIKAPQEINFSLIQRLSFRGLDKVRKLYNGMIKCNFYQFFKNKNKASDTKAK